MALFFGKDVHAYMHGEYEYNVIDVEVKLLRNSCED